jgi:hypothetical protein
MVILELKSAPKVRMGKFALYMTTVDVRGCPNHCPSGKEIMVIFGFYSKFSIFCVGIEGSLNHSYKKVKISVLLELFRPWAG